MANVLIISRAMEISTNLLVNSTFTCVSSYHLNLRRRVGVSHVSSYDLNASNERT